MLILEIELHGTKSCNENLNYSYTSMQTYRRPNTLENSIVGVRAEFTILHQNIVKFRTTQ
jgi:hypothetical protein